MVPEDKRKQLEELYETSFALYQASGPDRGRAHAVWWERRDADDDPLGVMELLATDIGGYVSRIVDRLEFEDLEQAIPHLRRMVVLDDPTLQRFSREHAGEYPDLMGYLQILETCRCEALALLEAARASRA
jgi:hypothetical protein